jgi:TetR/AcrR family transcriptional regulator, transcriptional repressor for nem operon
VEEVSTSERLLDEAQRLVQLRGFNGFSYADLSESIGIRKPSIHYHFPSKQDLGFELVRHYRRRLQVGLQMVATNHQDPKERLNLYVAFFGQLIREGKLCLCAALAADQGSLSEAIRFELQGAFLDKTTWLEQNLGTLGIAHPAIAAQQMVATVEGAMLLTRAFDNPEIYNDICQNLLSSFQNS